MVDSREMVAEDEERVSIQYEVSQQRSNFGGIDRLSSSKNFICKRKNFILDTLIDFEPV